MRNRQAYKFHKKESIHPKAECYAEVAGGWTKMLGSFARQKHPQNKNIARATGHPQLQLLHWQVTVDLERPRLGGS